MLARPRFIVLDTATLGRLAKDTWSGDTSARENALTFVKGLADLGCSIVVELTHLIELLRHKNPAVVDDRMRFLRSLPLIAWPRPYDRHWFVGSCSLDIGAREIERFLEGTNQSFADILEAVRVDLWETGVGNDMFPDRPEFWSELVSNFQGSEQQDRYIASFAKPGAHDVGSRRVGDAKLAPPIPEREIPLRAARLAEQLTDHVEESGDKRLENVRGEAVGFAGETSERIRAILASGGDIAEWVCREHGIPRSLVDDDMSVSELGDLAVESNQLRILARRLDPLLHVDLTVVPPGSLPTLSMNRELTAIQQKASRVSGSDLGDGHLAALCLYADVTEVDRRTAEYLGQIQRNHSKLGAVMRSFVRSSEYPTLLERISDALA